MNEDQKELFSDLLTKKAISGLDDREQQQFEHLNTGNRDEELRSLEMTAAAINVAGLGKIEPIPSHLRARIIADSHDHVGLLDTIYSHPRPVLEQVSAEKRVLGSWFGWLGWVAA